MNLRSLRNTKGQMRIIETILASFIIVAALSFVSIFSVSPASPGYEMADLEKTGYSALHDLDQQGLLAPLVYYPQNWSSLRTVLKITMPNDVYFNLAIYKLGGERLNGDPNSQILYGDSETFSDAKNIVSLAYCLVGIREIDSSTGQLDEANYDPRVLVLQLTRG